MIEACFLNSRVRTHSSKNLRFNVGKTIYEIVPEIVVHAGLSRENLINKSSKIAWMLRVYLLHLMNHALDDELRSIHQIFVVEN